MNKVAVIAAEEFTAPLAGKFFGKNVNRRLSAWARGVVAEALDGVSSCRGATIILVNSA
jgi:hypothetical protein